MISIAKTVVVSHKDQAKRAREFFNALGPDEAIPHAEFEAKLQLSHSHALDITRHAKARVTLMVDGRPTLCVVNPKTAERLSKRGAK